MVDEQDQRITETIAQEQTRLRNFIRRRVPDRSDAEDILQDVFYELVEAYRLMKPIEQVGAWMFRVARNRITDLFRKKRPESLQDQPVSLMDSEMFTFEELDSALDELPAEQREVFIAHEIEGRSFKDLAAETGVGVSTLISRKHYAVMHLRERLRSIYDEFDSI